MVMHPSPTAIKEEHENYDIDKLYVDNWYFEDPLRALGEKSFNEPYEVPEHEIGTPIQEFFRGKNVLITGATGFMGKLLTEKLIRSMPHLNKLYIVIRSKNGKDVETRSKELFDDSVFKRIKYEKPNFMEKIQVISGDSRLPNFGFSPEIYNELSNTVDLIFHGAAIVKMDEKINIVIESNSYGTLQIINLAKSCKNLKCFLYISTAFSNWQQLMVAEDIYPLNINYKILFKLIKNKSDKELERITPNIIGCWPNTYSFSKAVAENIIALEGRGFPIVIFRPAIVISTYMEPVRGWIDNLYGPTALIVGVGLGIIHVCFGDDKEYLDVVPGDMAVNGIIAAMYKGSLEKPVERKEDIMIYNYSSANDNPINVKEYTKLNLKYGFYWPSQFTIWHMFVITTTNSFLFFILHVFLHLVPGYIIDFFTKLAGKKPRLVKIYTKYRKFTKDVLKTYFGNGQVIISENVKDLWQWLSPEDKIKFPFNIRDFNWDHFYQTTGLGVRVYFLKDDISNLPVAKRNSKILYYVHYMTGFIFGSLFLIIVWKFIKFFLTYSNLF